MTPTQVLDAARRTWPLPWQLNPPTAELRVVSAEVGALSVTIALTDPLTLVGTLGEEDFFEAEIDDLPAALAELERQYRRLSAASAQL